mmetsp:Transcript_13714/g.35578  ORF Transcript_13714/g.35578 Transcript_13714/m.35578 type:complete len:306 (+) Transcript_13714:78-995(+)|eukprot:CAMPEP_0119406902 /NCGR_PEP_ID=MMETSP1335-20130426/1046_1 /TAXON_ID=259385 /ORGANISM="Chrysoculter rhomboideus, Strain RCC1486" /LENGTH=305 /DNA_ID=CAMNT_0007430995 /DNA_START=67 /DNA_END=984 /DNA_ORIENTATION=-
MGAIGALLAWMPTWDEFVAGLTFVEREHMSDRLMQEANLSRAVASQVDFFSDASIFCGDHWQIPLMAVVLYLLMITIGPQLMANRDPLPVNSLACCWNFALSAFSLCGMLSTWSTVGHRLLTEGLESTICGHPVFMGYGWIGYFMLFFIWSKLFELIDTVFLVAKKADVIFLHWYHHVTVLCYCWHSYAVRIPSGIWFAAMNYFVHAVMYAYFGMTQIGPKQRKLVRPYARLITTCQLSQMGVGLAVNGLTIYYQSLGHKCYANKTNTILSWIMYASYFVLFGILYLKNYIFKKLSHSPKRKKAD